MSHRFVLCVSVVVLARCQATSPTTTQQFHQSRNVAVGGMLLQVLDSANLVSTALYVFGSYLRFADRFRISLKEQPAEEHLLSDMSASRCASQAGSVKCETDRSTCRLVYDEAGSSQSGGYHYWCYHDAVFTRFRFCTFHDSSRECQCSMWVSRTEQRQACNSCSDLWLDCENMLDSGYVTGQSTPMTTLWTDRIQPSYKASYQPMLFWIAASISFAATVVWMARSHFRSVSVRAQILIVLGFGCLMPVALGVLVFSTLLIDSSAMVGVLLIFWVSVAWGVLLWRGCMQAGAAEERRSAMLQVPLLGVWVMSKLTPQKFKAHQEKFWAYRGGLCFVEDIPQAIIAVIDLCLYGGSYFSVLDLSLSVIGIFVFLSSEPSWRLIKHMSALSEAHFVACLVACRGCVVSCIKRLDACVEDVAGRDEAEEEAAEDAEDAVEGKVLEEEVMTSFTNPLYSNPWEVDSVE